MGSQVTAAQCPLINFTFIFGRHDIHWKVSLADKSWYKYSSHFTECIKSLYDYTAVLPSTEGFEQVAAYHLYFFNTYIKDAEEACTEDINRK